MTTPWSDVGEATARERKRARDSNRHRAETPLGRKHGSQRPCANTVDGVACAHRVNGHFTASEDPGRGCSIPGCLCREYKAPAA